ncbi:spermatogenesis-associated protein 31D4-like isoform X2 [Mesocricetus auratus]|uniref:Spermatogenesis-associated protein 31D4-like isoform X2 n=1 Tax=Mesocricetus auratus TaxID=10036 RepID=A0ABM2YB59_MESAU|nr:spermatogenesis-associated protein 31D4-like isoform X2 [Mesocricetus auratus]
MAELWTLLLGLGGHLPQDHQDVRQQQGRAKKGRRASFKEFRLFHREAQERRKLLSVVQSPLGQLYDASHFRQALCPDPCCDVCNGATAKVSRLLSWGPLDDGAASASSAASTASVTETSLTPSPPLSPSPSGCPLSSPSPAPSPPPPPPSPSVASTNKATPLEDLLLRAPQGGSPPSEPVLTSTDFPLGHNPPHPPPEAQPAAPQTEGSAQLETLPSAEGGPREPFATASTSREARGDTPGFSTSQPGCLVNSHSSEGFSGRQASVYFTMPGKPSFPDSRVLALLDGQDKSQADILTPEDKEGKADSFQKVLAAWQEISRSELQNSGGSLPLGGGRGRLSELGLSRRLAGAQVSEDQLEPKPPQHFWGLPYLHSESMHTVATLSAHCSSTCFWFNRAPDASALTHPTVVSMPEGQPQSLGVLLAETQAQLQPPIPMPPLSSSRSQIRICGVYFHRSQGETEALLQSEVHLLECSILTERWERVWALPSGAQKSQEEFRLLPSKPSLVRRSSKTHAPKHVPPGNFPLTDAFRKKLEYHLRKRLILQRWGLPQRIFKSQPWTSPDFAESPVSSCEFSWVSLFGHHDSKDPHDPVPNQPGSSQERCSESLPPEGKMAEAGGQSSETVQRHLQSNSKGALDNSLQSDCEENPRFHSRILPTKPSGTSQVSQCRKKIETALQKHLIRRLVETHERQIPGTVSRSGNRPLPFTSIAGKEGREAQRQSPSDKEDGHVKSKSVLQQTSIVLNNTSLEESESNKHSQDVPRISNEAGPVSLGKRLYPSKTVRGHQGTKVNDKSTFVSNKVSNTVKGGQLSGLESQPTKILNTSQGKSTQGADGNTAKVQSTLVAGRALKETSGPHESQISDYNSRVSREEKFKPESRLPIQVLGPPNDKLPASDEFTCKPSPTRGQSPSRGPVSVSQVRRQETWKPPHVLGKGQSKDIPSSARKLWPAPWKTEELGTGAARPGTLQASRKSCHSQESLTQGGHGEKPPQPLPAKAQTPPEHQFRKHFKQLLQRLSPDRKCKGQETLQRKDASPSPPAQDPELLRGRATFPGNTIAQKAMRDPGKVPKEQLGHRYGAADATRSRVPLTTPTKPVKTKPKKEGWVPAEPVQGRLFHHQAVYPKVPSPRSYHQATAFVGQRSWVEDRQPQKRVVSQPEVHRNFPSRRVGQVPRAASSLPVGTVFADLSRLCEQKILAQNFSGKGFLPQK